MEFISLSKIKCTTFELIYRLVPENPIISGEIEQVPFRQSAPPVPVMIQPGFQAPDYMQSARFLLAFGTATVTTTQTSTYSFILTAKCNSSTGFLVCGYTGK